tara:strand:- start:172 stop:594 length:423 start_codon:yes stop_codon:yes gene_type:complete
MPPRRSWTSSQKREVAARQLWHCAHCQTVLTACYELDHIEPLHKGGSDDILKNGVAICPNCHSQKTLRERLELERELADAIAAAKKENAAKTPPSRALLPPSRGPEILKNRFLRFAYSSECAKLTRTPKKTITAPSVDNE